MAIQANQVQKGWLFKTPNNQERVVLGFNSEGQVVYAYRGGNVKGKFATRQASSIDRFVKSCSERVEQYTDEKLAEVMRECNAEGLSLSS